MTVPIERFKDSYINHRWNPFTDSDMATDKEEDHLFIPAGAPFLIQLLEVPRKNIPTTITVYCYDDVANFTEVFAAPAQGEFRVDYPPADGEGTGLVEFNQNDATKEVKINYKATGSPMLSEFLDTKVSYPASAPSDHQILGFVSGAPAWRYNPIRYFTHGPVLYNAAGESESCLIFRFKKTANEATVILELKGAKMNQGFYTELKEHLHAFGTLAGSQATHVHPITGSTADAGAFGNHTHWQGSLAGTQATHNHGGATGGTSAGHVHGMNAHAHDFHNIEPGASSDTTDTPSTPNTEGQSADHTHSITAGGDEAVAIAGEVDPEGAQAAHAHGAGTLATSAAGNQAVTISGSTANTGGSPKIYGSAHKVYINGVDKTADLLALSALAAFGDGTAGHGFVTTGSGELDISALVAAAQFHEIKVTEPTAAKGGQVLLHLEVY